MERRRRRREQQQQQQQDIDTPSIDRFSALPDDIICRILSFLPTKLSVSTSVLSQRWRLLWAHVPTLDFDVRSHHLLTPSLSTIISNTMSVQQNNALDLHTFHLCYGFENSHDGKKKEQREVETWIASAMSRKVQILHLRLRNALPQCLFTCPTLVELTLDSCTCQANPPAQVSWPSLKKLTLSHFELCSFDEDIPRLLCGCPVLEEFVIQEWYGIGIDDGDNKSEISWPKLKRLLYSMFGDNRSAIHLNAPALRYFHVGDDEDNMNVSISRKNSLTEADIYLCEGEYAFEKNTDPKKTQPVEFLDCLSNNVKSLKLSGFCHHKVLGIATPETTVKFYNLTKLEIRMDCSDYDFIVKLLEIADNLQVLIVDANRIKNWIEPKQVPTCLLLHLRTIRIEQMSCTEHEFCAMRFLLMNALVLERMEISPLHDKFDFKANSDAIQIISSFERGSTACELAFH